jgi:hypothetical protein
LLLVATPTLVSSARGVAVMTLRTGRRGQVGSVTVAAGSSFVVDALPITCAWVRPGVRSAPVVGAVTPGTVCAKQTKMVRRVGMAARTGRRQSGINPCYRVTAIALQTGMATRQREEFVVKTGRQPAQGGMTGATACAKAAIMFIIPGMAGITIGGSSLKNIVDVAAFTSYVDMPARQFEDRQVMVEGGREPARSGVTGGTACAEPAVVFIVPGMAGITIGGSPLENMVDMAAFARYVNVLAFQLECEQVMVNSGGEPARGRMAGGAIGAITAIVYIIRSMTRVTVGGSPLENMVDMAAFAADICMFPFQLEDRQIMVKEGRCPTSGSMAGCTVSAISALVCILCSVTGVAILRHRLEVKDGAGPKVAGGTGQPNMFARQREQVVVVVEGTAISINPIMTSPAIGPEGKYMPGGKDLVDLFVTCLANSLIKLGIALGVTIVATKGRSIRVVLVTFE